MRHERLNEEMTGYTLRQTQRLADGYLAELWEHVDAERHPQRVRVVGPDGRTLPWHDGFYREGENERATERMQELVKSFANDSWLIEYGRKLNVMHEVGEYRVEQLVENGLVHRYRLVHERRDADSGGWKAPARIIAWSGPHDTDEHMRKLADAIAAVPAPEPFASRS